MQWVPDEALAACRTKYHSGIAALRYCPHWALRSAFRLLLSEDT
ncbi:MAG: hypothetical protein ACUVTZ_12645 [Armatimonadota bacterium]